MNYIRKYWFPLLVIAIAILWWHIFDLFLPHSQNWITELKNVNYESLLTNPTLIWVRFLGFPCIAILAGLLAFVYIPPNGRVLARLIAVLASLGLCILSTYTSVGFNPKARTETIEHIMSLNYQARVYNLALSTYGEPFGEAWLSYYIFECDSSGKVCSKIKEIGIELQPDTSAKLIVSDNKLILDRGSEQIQILPAVN